MKNSSAVCPADASFWLEQEAFLDLEFEASKVIVKIHLSVLIREKRLSGTLKQLLTQK